MPISAWNDFFDHLSTKPTNAELLLSSVTRVEQTPA